MDPVEQNQPAPDDLQAQPTTPPDSESLSTPVVATEVQPAEPQASTESAFQRHTVQPLSSAIAPSLTEPAESDVPAAAAAVPDAVPESQPESASPTVTTPQVTGLPQLPTPPEAPTGIVVGGSGGGPSIVSPNSASPGLPKRRRWPVFAAALVALLLLGGGYAFAFYLPNTPSATYSTGLNRTGKAYGVFVDYLSQQQSKHYKGYAASGTLKLTSDSGSGDGSFSVQTDGSNTTGQFAADIVGQKFSGNYVAIQAKDQTVPDVYLQVSGIKSMADSFGLDGVGQLDGQWIAIDHTVIETGLAKAQSAASSSKTPDLNFTDVHDALNKLGAVNQKYLFTSDPKYAVLVKQKYLGTSTQDGRKVAGYQVTYNKANLKAYVAAAGTALDSSSLNTWVKTTAGKSISDSLQLKDANSQIDNLKAGYSFNVYVDKQTKLIHKLHFPDSKDGANNYLELGLNYTGGSKYPLVLAVASKEGNTTQTGGLTLTIDTATNEANGEISFVAKGDSTTNMKLEFSIKPSDKAVAATAPAGAKPVMQILQGLGLSGALDGTGQGEAKDTERQTDMRTVQSQLEAAYANNGVYPTLAQVNSSSWRATNMAGLDPESLKDPEGSSSQLVAQPGTHVYAYQASGCTASGCSAYVLTATLANGTPYTLDSLN